MSFKTSSKKIQDLGIISWKDSSRGRLPKGSPTTHFGSDTDLSQKLNKHSAEIYGVGTHITSTGFSCASHLTHFLPFSLAKTKVLEGYSAHPPVFPKHTLWAEIEAIRRSLFL
ncbi:hypothetical protein JTE90_002286 [Oedothorax gibbosus]|uniref:Uncharacterized protein n=1 Tax=Oedothorax gibbosus TaxID=931172 RepID=A0AAV6U870_9ARAC|nr:hypothetical protein JTE90_002286 [Oedothorax gibbosus]